MKFLLSLLLAQTFFFHETSFGAGGPNLAKKARFPALASIVDSNSPYDSAQKFSIIAIRLRARHLSLADSNLTEEKINSQKRICFYVSVRGTEPETLSVGGKQIRGEFGRLKKTGFRGVGKALKGGAKALVGTVKGVAKHGHDLSQARPMQISVNLLDPRRLEEKILLYEDTTFFRDEYEMIARDEKLKKAFTSGKLMNMFAITETELLLGFATFSEEYKQKIDDYEELTEAQVAKLNRNAHIAGKGAEMFFNAAKLSGELLVDPDLWTNLFLMGGDGDEAAVIAAGLGIAGISAGAVGATLLGLSEVYKHISDIKSTTAQLELNSMRFLIEPVGKHDQKKLSAFSKQHIEKINVERPIFGHSPGFSIMQKQMEAAVQTKADALACLLDKYNHIERFSPENIHDHVTVPANLPYLDMVRMTVTTATAEAINGETARKADDYRAIDKFEYVCPNSPETLFAENQLWEVDNDLVERIKGLRKKE